MKASGATATLESYSAKCGKRVLGVGAKSYYEVEK